jgi:hypothetical protein
MYNTAPASGNGELSDWAIARVAVIPHGSSFTATGPQTTVTPANAKGGDVMAALLVQQAASFKLHYEGRWGEPQKEQGRPAQQKVKGKHRAHQTQKAPNLNCREPARVGAGT